MPGLTQQAESYKTPTPVGKAGRAWCPDQYPDFKHGRTLQSTATSE